MSIWTAGKDLIKLLQDLQKTFISELILEDIFDKDYLHAQKVFNEYCTGMGDYHNLYVQTGTFCLQMFLKNLERQMH